MRFPVLRHQSPLDLLLVEPLHRRLDDMLDMPRALVVHQALLAFVQDLKQ